MTELKRRLVKGQLFTTPKGEYVPIWKGRCNQRKIKFSFLTYGFTISELATTIAGEFYTRVQYVMYIEESYFVVKGSVSLFFAVICQIFFGRLYLKDYPGLLPFFTISIFIAERTESHLKYDYPYFACAIFSLFGSPTPKRGNWSEEENI